MSVAKTSERFESSSECFMCSSRYVWYTFNGKLVFSKMLSSYICALKWLKKTKHRTFEIPCLHAIIQAVFYKNHLRAVVLRGCLLLLAV